MAEEESETPYTTTRAIEFMEQAKDESWCLHLSYIKPHWPYIVPAPYHDMYGKDDIQPVKRDACEKEDPHPLLAGYFGHRYSHAFSRDDVRETVIPAYMGLITQIDDQIGRLMTYLEESGQIDDTSDRVYVGPRRLPWRSLAGRERAVSRSIGPYSFNRY